MLQVDDAITPDFKSLVVDDNLTAIDVEKAMALVTQKTDEGTDIEFPWDPSGSSFSAKISITTGTLVLNVDKQVAEDR